MIWSNFMFCTFDVYLILESKFNIVSRFISHLDCFDMIRQCEINIMAYNLYQYIEALENSKVVCLDDLLCERNKHVASKYLVWMHNMTNNTTLQPGKKSCPFKPRKGFISLLKVHIQISSLCHTYKLFSRLLLN